jgi:hypothetical protein
MKSLFFAAVALSLALPAKAEVSPKLPDTKAEYYYTGETFAYCSAHWDFMALTARKSERPATAEAFDGQKRGWHAAGLILLAAGMDESRQVEAEAVFGAMIETKVIHFRALKEANRNNWGADMIDEFKEKCIPWTPFQKALVAGMNGISTEE